MFKIEGQFTIKKKWFNNKGTFKIEQTPKKVIGTYTYGKTENKIDMGRLNGDTYFEFCGNYATKFGPKYYSFTANVLDGKFEGNFENKRGVKKVVGTVTYTQLAAESAPVKEAPKAAPVKEEVKNETASAEAPKAPAKKPAAPAAKKPAAKK